MKELRSASSSFRLRSRLVECARLGSYFILMLFAMEIMDDFLPTVWLVTWLTLSFILVDWILCRLLLIPAADLEIQKMAQDL